tara:strand:+ start:252 stop:509 length:258 start_codon:yes stop_codon:yes gene_type:complete
MYYTSLEAELSKAMAILIRVRRSQFSREGNMDNPERQKGAERQEDGRKQRIDMSCEARANRDDVVGDRKAEADADSAHADFTNSD